MKTSLHVTRTPSPDTPASSRGDAILSSGVAGASMVIEAFDLDGTLKYRTEMALELFDNSQFESFRADWRGRMDRKRRSKSPPSELRIV